jgi:carboxypeptidase family protein/TonB-dependent receptor-like protein
VREVSFLLVMSLLCLAPAVAQSPNATINGIVLDPSGAAIAGAQVMLANDVTGVQYTTKTNGEGIYVVPNVPPGPYRIQVSNSGFKTIIKPDIVIHVQDALAINFTLPIGAASEIVTVEGGTPMINTTNASVSTIVDQTYVRNMPLNGRSFQTLILLTPGIVTQTSQSSNYSALGQTGEFSVNGQRTESNYYTVDGVSANVGVAPGFNMTSTGAGGSSGSVPAATASGTTQALVSVDALQEFRIQSSTYSAEYGRNPGGQFAFETKSGTNQLHGTAYDYLRNGSFDAQDWFNNYFGEKGPALRQNDFGGTLGGLVRIPGLHSGKDRTFFFVSYEGLRLTAPQAASVSYVPDTSLRANAPASLRPALNAFPLPSTGGIDDTTNGFAQFIGSWSNKNSIDSTSIRFDHFISDKLRFFFRFSDTTSDSGARAGFYAPSTQLFSSYAFRTYTAAASSVISNHLANEFRLNYSSNNVTSRRAINAFGGNTPISLPDLVGAGAGSSVSVLFLYGGYSVQLAQVGMNAGTQRQWDIVDTVSLSRGRHRVKLGLDYRRLSPIAIPPNPAVSYFYFSESSVIANSAFLGASTFAPAYPLFKNFSAFAQDEWKASQRLSLSFGLRWEVNPAPGVTQGANAYTIRGSSPNTLALAPKGTPLWNTTWFNFAPRLGLAYILHDRPHWDTILRAGGGVFFDTGQQLGAAGFFGPGHSASVAGSPVESFPALPAIPSIVDPPVAPYSSSPIGFAAHLQLPYTLQWNGSIEQTLSKSQALSVSYVGAHASRLLQEYVIRPANNPNSSTFFFFRNGVTSDYDSLQVQFRRELSSGLTALGSYTWSHCMDYGSLNFDFGYQRGNCDFDVRHNLSAAFSYDLPNAGHNTLIRTLGYHWGLDGRFTGRTSFPVTLSGGRLADPATGVFYYAGLNIVPRQPIYLYGTNCASALQGLKDLKSGQGCPGGSAINPQAFTSVSSGIGDAPRNFVRGFGAWQMDAAVRREFPIHERMNLQFRVEAFNIFNHPNFGFINPAFGQTTFGQATATLANSLGVLSPLYQMGGPRSMQFALKLAF